MEWEDDPDWFDDAVTDVTFAGDENLRALVKRKIRDAYSRGVIEGKLFATSALLEQVIKVRS